MGRNPFGWDLPPGCSDSDIPGNRPEDIDREKWEDEMLPSVIGNFIDQNQETILELVNEFFLDGAYGVLGKDLEARFEDFLDKSYKEQVEE